MTQSRNREKAIRMEQGMQWREGEKYNWGVHVDSVNCGGFAFYKVPCGYIVKTMGTEQ